MNLEQMSSEFPPPFYTLPEAFATAAEMMYFECGMLVNLANEIRALRLDIESFHAKHKVEVTNAEPGTASPPNQEGE